MNPYLEKLQNGPTRGFSIRRARVEIVPLIDVMFLLVAFFMLVSMAMVMQKGIFVDLSPSETGDSSINEVDELVISVDNAGALYLNKSKIESHELSQFLRDTASKDPKTSVVINADKEARHKSVIKALDIVRNSGLHNVIFSVEPNA